MSNVECGTGTESGHWETFALCLCPVCVLTSCVPSLCRTVHCLHRSILLFAERKECRPSCLQHGHSVYCQTCRTVPNSPPERFVLSVPDTNVLSRLCGFSFPPDSFLTSFSSSSFKASGDSQVVSSSCVSSCLVSWCVCSCQYLCLLWIACFSP